MGTLKFYLEGKQGEYKTSWNTNTWVFRPEHLEVCEGQVRVVELLVNGRSLDLGKETVRPGEKIGLRVEFLADGIFKANLSGPAVP